MKNKQVRTESDIEKTVQTYGDMLFRICFLMLKNQADAEDAVQDIIIRYIESTKSFETNEHKKAWLIAVATNRCRDMLRYRSRHPADELTEVSAYVSSPQESDILTALMQLPEKYRIVMVLHYVEQYKVNEIARMLHKGESAIKMRLQKGRQLLKELYGKEN